MGDERFESGAAEYADYLRTVEGRLRLDLAMANVREFVDDAHESIENRRALDVGGGTGAQAIQLAKSGWRVSVLDSSAAMLALAARAAGDANLSSERIQFYQAEAEQVDELFAPQSFHLVICHNVLEYVDDSLAVLKSLKKVVAKGGMVSILVRSRAGEAMRAALKAHDLASAESMLTAEWAIESLYGGKARLFDEQSCRGLCSAAGLDVLATRGIRVVADYLPPELSATDDGYARLLAFERRCGAMTEFASVARYLQTIARRASV